MSKNVIGKTSPRSLMRELKGVMRWGDWVIIAVGIALSIATALMVWLPAKAQGGYANVYVDARLVATLPLDNDREYVIDGLDPAYENVLEITGGAAHMLHANCADGYCVRQGFVRYDGDAIICLPHRVVIEIVGGEENALDAIAG